MGKVPAITSPGSFDRCVTKATGQADESAWNKVKSLDNVQVLVKPVRFRIQAIYLERGSELGTLAVPSRHAVDAVFSPISTQGAGDISATGRRPDCCKRRYCSFGVSDMSLMVAVANHQLTRAGWQSGASGISPKEEPEHSPDSKRGIGDGSLLR